MVEEDPAEIPDKISEKRMAELLGTTARALQGRRDRGQIPEGVWNKIGRRIIYSRRRYDEWLESQWICPPGWRSEATQSVSVSLGAARGAAKPSRIPRRGRASQLHPVLEIR